MEAIHLIQGYQYPKYLNLKKIKSLPTNTTAIHLHGHAYVFMKLLHSRAFRISTQIVFALIFTSFLLTNLILSASPLPVPASAINPADETISYSSDVNLLSLVFHDLQKEGLFKTGDKAILMGSSSNVDDYGLLDNNNVDLVSSDDLNGQSFVPDESYDLAFVDGINAVPDFIDRVLKESGIAVVQLLQGLSMEFNKPLNYKIVYVRRFQSTILAMRKSSDDDVNTRFSSNRRLLGYTTEARKAALNKLEDVLLEPPRASSHRSSRYLKRTKFLPDLMEDSLESYPRRVFIDVGSSQKKGEDNSKWFLHNYPTRNLDFETYKIETVADEISGKEVTQVEKMGMSDWLKKNLKEEEYVVMKAEAEIVEEMVKNKVTSLVDELFLDCKPSAEKGNRRAYWECLALYGRLRDDGVAVHQWWG